jgi:choline kinase
VEALIRGILMNAFDPKDTSVIICCAGMGTRLGIGTTKALVDICGKPLIIRLLESLHDYDDIRIVVGFQAERLIHVVTEFRKDIMFAFNYDYETTGVADSLRKALVGVREYVISLDGDTLENPEDFTAFLAYKNECLGISPITSAEPVMATVEDGYVVNLSKKSGNYQWSGIVKIKADKLKGKSSHVYDVLNAVLPIPAFIMRTREIDTPDDYDRAIEWFESGMVG